MIKCAPKRVAMRIGGRSGDLSSWPSLVNPPYSKFDHPSEGNTSNKLWAFQRPWKRTSFQRRRVRSLPAGGWVAKRSTSWKSGWEFRMRRFHSSWFHGTESEYSALKFQPFRAKNWSEQRLPSPTLLEGLSPCFPATRTILRGALFIRRRQSCLSLA